MNKKILILIGVLFLILILLLVITSKGKNSKLLPGAIPANSPQASNQAGLGPFTVINSYPKDGDQNIPPNITLQFTFNQNPDINQIKFNLNPTPNYSLHLISKTVYISFSQSLSPSTTYRAGINYNGSNIYNFSFITAKTASKDTAPDPSAIQQEQDQLRQQRPDIYLSNQIPYSNDQFSIKLGGLKTTPQEHFYFIAVLKNTNQDAAKASLNSWLQSLQLTSDQINNLEFIYLTPDQDQSVSTLKTKLPYFDGPNFTITYDKSTDKTTITIFGDRNTGEANLSNYLNQNNIADKYWINNLVLQYK